jgi:hypothetical protein
VLLYGAVALAVERRWISGLAAAAVAVLLWWRHPRARFSAYVFLSVAVLRGIAGQAWWAVALGGAAILLLQTRAARATWPRLPWRGLRPGAPPPTVRPDDGGRIARP